MSSNFTIRYPTYTVVLAEQTPDETTTCYPHDIRIAHVEFSLLSRRAERFPATL